MSTQTPFRISPDPDPSPSGRTLLILSFSSIQQLSITQSGWNETLYCGNELLYTHSGECSSLYLHSIPTRSLIISTYQSPILQSPSQIPTPRTMRWIWFPREKLLPSLNSCSSLKTPNIYLKLSCVLFFSLQLHDTSSMAKKAGLFFSLLFSREYTHHSCLFNI